MYKQISPFKSLLFLLLAVNLVACGGDSGGGGDIGNNGDVGNNGDIGDNTNTGNHKPIITVQAEASYNERSEVLILVEAVDTDGSIQAIKVDQISGPNTSYVFYDGKLTFTAPEVTVDTDITFKVTATDDNNASSEQLILIKIKQMSLKDLTITEISSSRYWNDNRWIEVYNGTTRSILLNEYQLLANSVDYNGNVAQGVQVFGLPNKVIAPGDFMILQSKHGSSVWQSFVEDSSQLALISGNDQIRFTWNSSGFVELQKTDGTTVDFVRFGDSQQNPASDGEWNSASGLNRLPTELGSSLVRDDIFNDSNSADDWRFSSYVTPGGINDIKCSEDNDADGIPDCAELPETTFAGLPLYEWGARVGVRDIFIEVDYMESSDPGIQIHRESLDKVKAAFEEQNIMIHFDVGGRFHPENGISPEDYDLGGGNQVTFNKSISFKSLPDSPSILDYKVKNFDIRRRPIFHYMLMANSQKEDGSAGSSGLAEINGNDLIISLGNWGFSLNNESSRNILYNRQSSTIMHELGHNLGLLHGGNDDVNRKPNHVSIMNYLYQLNGLPTIGNNEGDRYFKYFYSSNSVCFPNGTKLVNGPEVEPSQFKISYSHGNAALIDEQSIDEKSGLGLLGSQAVDFNCNGSATEIVANFDLNGNGSSMDQLTDFDEWSNLNLAFSTYWNGAGGAAYRSTNDSETRAVDVMNSDSQPLIEESEPSQELLQEIRRVAEENN